MTEGTPNDHSNKNDEDRVQDWWRIAPMIFFALIAYFVLWLMFIGALLQYISVAAQGEKAQQISGFNKSVRQYLIDIFDYLIYKRDDMPFPFGDFPFTNPPQGANTHEGFAPESPAPRPEKPVKPQAPATAAAAPGKPAPKQRAAPRAKPATATKPKPAAKKAASAKKPTTTKKPATPRPKRASKPPANDDTTPDN